MNQPSPFAPPSTGGQDREPHDFAPPPWPATPPPLSAPIEPTAADDGDQFPKELLEGVPGEAPAPLHPATDERPAFPPELLETVPGAPPAPPAEQDQPATPAPAAPAAAPAAIEPAPAAPEPPRTPLPQSAPDAAPLTPQPATSPHRPTYIREAAPQAPAPKTPKKPSWVRRWLIPLLVALALVAIIVVGLITAMTATPPNDSETSAPSMHAKTQGRDIIMLGQLAPEPGAVRER
jgi:hypothetical protein